MFPAICSTLVKNFRHPAATVRSYKIIISLSVLHTCSGVYPIGIALEGCAYTHRSWVTIRNPSSLLFGICTSTQLESFTIGWLLASSPKKTPAAVLQFVAPIGQKHKILYKTREATSLLLNWKFWVLLPPLLDRNRDLCWKNHYKLAMRNASRICVSSLRYRRDVVLPHVPQFWPMAVQGSLHVPQFWPMAGQWEAG